MKPFQIPAWRQRQINEKYRRKARVIYVAVNQMEAVMQEAVNSVYQHAVETGHFAAPTLNGMFSVSEQFYRNVVEQAFYASQDEKRAQQGRKKLARQPKGLPRTMRDLNQVFRDRRYWPKIMKRSQALTERLRRQYTSKLRRKFEQMMPRITSGEWSPEQAKSHLMSAWKASESRVETIFRTETTNYFGQTQVAFFEGDPEIIGFLFDSVRDTARTDICKTRHGLIYRPNTKELRDNTPALHYNCRSHLIALANTPHNRKMLDDPERDPSTHRVAPLPAGWRR